MKEKREICFFLSQVRKKMESLFSEENITES